MLLSRTCVNAIRASLQVANFMREEGRTFVPIRDIADKIDVSHHFLGKIAQTLIEHGILKSFRGPNGGVALARPADQIHLIDIIEVTDGMGVFEECLLGLPECNEADPCPLHRTWEKSRASLLRDLEHQTLATVQKRRTRKT